MADWLTEAINRGVFIGQVCGILKSNPAQRINFAVSYIHVDGTGLGAVADALSEAVSTEKEDSFHALARIFTGARRPKRVNVSFGAQPAGAAATYTQGSNTVSAPVGFALNSWANRQMILHECVHSMQDILGGDSLFNTRGSPAFTLEVDNEAAAYVAGSLYYLYATGQAQSVGNPIYVVSQTIAMKIKDRPGATVDAADLATLRAAILAHPVYSHLTMATMTYSNG